MHILHRWLDWLAGGVNSEIVKNNPTEAAALIGIVEDEVMRRARVNGFECIFTINANKVTIVSQKKLLYSTAYY